MQSSSVVLFNFFSKFFLNSLKIQTRAVLKFINTEKSLEAGKGVRERRMEIHQRQYHVGSVEDQERESAGLEIDYHFLFQPCLKRQVMEAKKPEKGVGSIRERSQKVLRRRQGRKCRDLKGTRLKSHSEVPEIDV